MLINYRHLPVPEGWKETTMGCVAQVVGGGTPSTQKPEYWDGTVPWATPTDITALQSRFISSTANTINEQGVKNSGASLLPPQSVLMTSRATIGVCGINTVPMATNQGFANLVCKDGVNCEFLYYLMSVRIREMRQLASGSTFIELAKSEVRKLRILLPEINEQQRITGILSAVDAAIERTREVIAQTRRLKQALLQDLLTHGLPGKHKEFRSDKHLHQLPVSWESAQLADLLKLVTSGSRGWARYYTTIGALFLRITNLTREHINLDLKEKQHVCPPDTAEGRRTRVQPHDILISVTADLGIIGIAPPEIGEAYVNQHIALVRLDANLVNPLWVAYYLAGEPGQNQFRRLNDAGAKAGLNLPNIRSLRVALPSRDEQDAIVSLIRATEQRIRETDIQLEAQMFLKTALSQALLTGRKRVAVGGMDS